MKFRDWFTGLLIIFGVSFFIYLASPEGSSLEENTLWFVTIYLICSPFLIYLGYRFVQRFDPTEKSILEKISDKINQYIAEGIENRKRKERRAQDLQQMQYNQERDQLLFQRFHELLKTHPVIAKSEVSQNLGISNDELFVRLIEWNKIIPFQINNNIIYNEPGISTNSRVCSRCGESNPSTAEFCSGCGLPLQN